MHTGRTIRAIIGTLIISLAGCQSVNKPPKVEPAVAEKVERLLPVVLEWYTRTEQQLLPQGRFLTQPELQRALELGVQAPQEVRIAVLQTFPLPENEVVRQEAIKHGFGSPEEGGRTHGHLIMLKPEYQDNPIIISHELVHVAQIDRLGREAFLRQYLTELETVGYKASPLELKAYSKQLRKD